MNQRHPWMRSTCRLCTNFPKKITADAISNGDGLGTHLPVTNHHQAPPFRTAMPLRSWLRSDHENVEDLVSVQLGDHNAIVGKPRR
jgi:hypothetical protein